MEVADGDLLIDLDGAPLHTANGDPSYIFIIINRGNQQLHGAVLVALRGIDILDNGLEQGL